MADDNYFKLNKKGVIYTLAALGLVIASATAASYATREKLETSTAQVAPPAQTATDLKADTAPPANPTAAADTTAAEKPPVHHHPHHQQVAQNQVPPCNDSNIVGTAAGGIGGGLLGSAIGHGTGKTVATIGGALGGAYLGNQYIPTRNVTCR